MTQGDDPITDLTNFLTTEVFVAMDPDPETMQNYAQELFLAGFRNKEMLVENVKVDDVGKWRWMRMFHKDVFETWIEKK